jgi:hypothetical protein
LTKYYTELYFYANETENKGFTEIPNLDEYSKTVIPFEVSANSWESAKKQIMTKYPNVAYIFVLESKNLDI